MADNLNRHKHIFSIDSLRIIASIMVVAIHVDTITASPTNYLGGISWWLANIIQSISRSSVPIFIMMSGFLFIGSKTRRDSSNISKILRRYIVPTTFWVAIYFLTQIYWKGETYSIFRILNSLFYSEIGHLYYLYIIIGLYLGIPCIWKYLRSISITPVIISLLFVGIFELFIFNSDVYNPFLSAPLLWITYIPYFLLGYKLRNIKVSPIIPLTIILIMTITNSLSSYFGYTNLSSNIWWMNKNGNYFLGNFSPTVIMMSMSIFILITNLVSEGNTRLNQIERYLAAYTYGIFLIHPFIIPLFDRFTNLPVHRITHDLWLYLIVKIIIIYLISYILVFLLKLSKSGRTIIGES